MALSLQRYTGTSPDNGLYRILKERVQKEREKSKVISMVIGDVLPESMIIEILSWLPVKALLQFKSVCKTWYALISSPDFISKHLNNYYNNSDSDCLLAHCYSSRYHGLHDDHLLFELLVDETQTESPPRVLAHEILNNSPMHGSYICGPCDGLYYVCDYEYPGGALWNPALNELKRLPSIVDKPDPPSNITYRTQLNEVFGLGYDSSAKDYKVGVIRGYFDILGNRSQTYHPPSVLVYSLRADSWRYCGDLALNYMLTRGKCYTYVNGCYYWLGSCKGSQKSHVIICFDMSSDTFREISVPNYRQGASNILGLYHGSLAILSMLDQLRLFDIWTLNEGIWTKKFSMKLRVHGFFPVGLWKKNKILLGCWRDGLSVCDPDTQEVNGLLFQGDGNSQIARAFKSRSKCRGILVYKESLVSIKDRITRSGQGTMRKKRCTRVNGLLPGLL